MILVDTTPLVGLADPTDALHRRALSDLDRLARQRLLVCDPVLTEALHLLPGASQRARLTALLDALRIEPWVPEDVGDARAEALAWLGRYAEHEPDWADATLVIASQRLKRSRVWTYDSEFRTTWRRADGSRVPLVASRA